MENSFSLTAETVTHITRTCEMSVVYLFPLNADVTVISAQ